MISLLPAFPGERPPRMLFLGAHSDDIEIGAGATVLALARQYPAASVRWIVFSGSGDRNQEARDSAEYFLSGFADAAVEVHDFPDGNFPSTTADIKTCLEHAKESFYPDLILTHYREDRHQDHNVISDVTWQTFRNSLVLEYEIPKYDGDLGKPNFYCPVDMLRREQKQDALARFFGSQRNKGWFSRETFDGLMRLRGIECQSPTGFAEAFYCRKAVLDCGKLESEGET